MRKFNDFEVIALSRKLTVDLYQTVNEFPNIERYSLCQQIRRAAVSVGANIAEGAGRQTAKDFAHFLTQSIGSACELEYLLLIAQDLGYIQSFRRKQLDNQVQIIKHKLFRFRASLLNRTT
ncbi:MAG: four helix bundle protein [Bacteroidetes bacterium]|nr:four helix bundle protein [Bacteroidota bacterium]